MPLRRLVPTCIAIMIGVFFAVAEDDVEVTDQDTTVNVELRNLRAACRGASSERGARSG